MHSSNFVLLFILISQISIHDCNPIEKGGNNKEFDDENGKTRQDRQVLVDILRNWVYTLCGRDHTYRFCWSDGDIKHCKVGNADDSLFDCGTKCGSRCQGVNCCLNIPETELREKYTPPPRPPPPTTTTPPPPPPPTCFPSTGLVNLENGKSVTMSELKIGDQVQTVSSSGSIIYSEVTTFLKKQPLVVDMYKSITTSQNTLSLSRNHLIYTRKRSNGKFNPMYADLLSIDDEVLVKENDHLIPVKVINVSNSIMQGAYVPLIMEGKIVVDGVLTSCHASCYHDLAHIGTIPFQQYPEITVLIFGKEDGSPAYVNILREFSRWVLPFDQTK